MSDSENADLLGRWNLTLKGPRGKQPSVLVIERSDDGLTGSQSGSTGGSNPVSDVTIDGAKVSWVSSVSKPLPLKITFTGEIEGNNMSGKAKIGFMGSYPFTAVKE